VTKTALSPEVAVAGISKLRLLRGFPDDPKVFEVMAELLTRWCTGGRRWQKNDTADEQCAIVIDYAMEHLEKWESPARIRQFIDQLFPSLGGQ
jgi:hypothetical protein